MPRYERSGDIAIRFGRNVFRARRRAGLSQEELAVRAALPRTEVGLVEKGARVPRLDTILKLAGGVRADPCELLDGLVWMPGGSGEGSFYVAGGEPPRPMPSQ